MPARAIDTASISFGLVAIPVKIYSTSEPSHELHFHLVHAGCGERLHQQYVCPKHGVVSRDDMIRGFELTKGNVIELEKEELKALEAVATDEIALAEFVPLSAVDPLYVDASYYLAPDKGGDRAYALFRDALEHAALCGVASYSARGKAYIVMVRPYQDGLLMHQLRYPDEIKPWSEVPAGKLPKASPAELGLATKVIEALTHDTFDASQYTDTVKQRVRKLIAQKAKGGEIVVPEGAPRPEVTDLMAALRASLSGEAAKPDGKRAHAPTRRSAATARRATSHRPHAARARSANGKRTRAHR